MDLKKVIIIGGGPAGIAAALQLKRYGIDPVVFEKDRVGGLLKNADWIENYPGFPDGISGIDLVNLLEKHFTKHDFEFYQEKVESLEYDGKHFVVRTDQLQLKSYTVLIATGSESIPASDLSIPQELNNFVFYEVYPLLEIENKHIVIVGAGDIGFDYAINLSHKNQVIILNRGQRIKAIKTLQNYVNESENITYKDKSVITAVKKGDQKQLKLQLENENILETDYLVFAIGRKPALGFISDKTRNILTELETSGLLYMAGDLKDALYRQSAVAVGEGVKAALDIYKKLKEIS